MKRALIIMLSAALLTAAGCQKNEAKVSLPENVEPAAPTAQESTRGEAKGNAPAGTPATKAARATANTRGTITLTGSVESYRKTRVAANVSGIVDDVHVEEGEVVEKDDTLVDVDPANFRLRLRQAEASRGRARAQVDMLQTQANRVKQLLDRNAVPAAEYDTIAGQLDVAKAAVIEAEVGVSMARKMLADSKIRAPYDAVVTKVSVAEGDFAAAGPSPLIEITEVSRVRARIEVPEAYVDRVKLGDSLELYVPATGKSLPGSVERINPTVKQGTRSFAVLMKLDNPEMTLRPGMFIEAKLSAGDAK